MVFLLIPDSVGFCFYSGYGAGAGVPNGNGAKSNSKYTLFYILHVQVYAVLDNWRVWQTWNHLLLWWRVFVKDTVPVRGDIQMAGALKQTMQVII